MTTQPPAQWAGSQTIKNIEDVFKTAGQVATHKTGLKILIWGSEDTRKTGFCLSCPPPVYHVDTELGAPPLFDLPDYKEKWTKGEIKWCDATYLNPQTDIPDPEVMLQKLEATIGVLKAVEKGTVCIDSGTDVWDWIQAWLEGVGKHTEKGNVLMRTEWAKAKQKWRQLLLRLMAKPLHFVMTAQPQEIYAGNQPTGDFRPRIQGASQHVFDVIIHAQKWVRTDGNPPVKSVKYMAEITKCRFNKDFRPTIQDIMYDKLIMMLKEKLQVEVW